MMNNALRVVYCYGITKDPKTNNFMLLMEYATNGNLRHHLNNSFNSMDWFGKLDNLSAIASGLNDIHDNGLIHHDFHCGNILSKGYYGNRTDTYPYITWDYADQQMKNLKAIINKYMEYYLM